MPSVRRLGEELQQRTLAPCRVYATTPLALSGEATVDGVALSNGDRVLVGGQGDARDNGIYIVADARWRRASDFNEAADVLTGALINVTGGSGSGLYAARFDGQLSIGSTPMNFDFAASVTSPEVDLVSNTVGDPSALSAASSERVAIIEAALPTAPFNISAVAERFAARGPVVVPPGFDRVLVRMDVEANAFETDGDVALYDDSVEPQFRSDQPGSQFETYHPDIKNANFLYEAMRWGLPIVAADYGGPAAILDDRCAVMVPPTDPEAFVAGIADGIRRIRDDPEAAAAMGERARAKVAAEGLWSAKAERVAALYRSVMP